MAEKRTSAKTAPRRTVKVAPAASVKPALASGNKLGQTLFSKVKNPRIFTSLLVIILLAVSYQFKGLFIAAVVNGTPISRFTVTQELEKRSGKQILSSIVAQTLILQEAKKRNISVNQKEIEAAIKKIEGSLKSQGQNLDQALAIQGATRSDFIEQVKIQQLIEKMFSKDIKVTNQEIADYIEKNKESVPASLTGNDLNTSVKQQLTQQKLSTDFQTWLAEAQKNAKVMYFVNF